MTDPVDPTVDIPEVAPTSSDASQADPAQAEGYSGGEPIPAGEEPGLQEPEIPPGATP